MHDSHAFSIASYEHQRRIPEEEESRYTSLGFSPLPLFSPPRRVSMPLAPQTRRLADWALTVATGVTVISLRPAPFWAMSMEDRAIERSLFPGSIVKSPCVGGEGGMEVSSLFSQRTARHGTAQHSTEQPTVMPGIRRMLRTWWSKLVVGRRRESPALTQRSAPTAARVIAS